MTHAGDRDRTGNGIRRRVAGRARGVTPYTVFLRIRHPSIDPDELTRVLGLEPAHAWAAGSPRPSSDASAVRGIHRQSYWVAPLAPAEWAVGFQTLEADGPLATRLRAFASFPVPLEALLLRLHARCRCVQPLDHRCSLCR